MGFTLDVVEKNQRCSPVVSILGTFTSIIHLI